MPSWQLSQPASSNQAAPLLLSERIDDLPFFERSLVAICLAPGRAKPALRYAEPDDPIRSRSPA